LVFIPVITAFTAASLIASGADSYSDTIEQAESSFRAALREMTAAGREHGPETAPIIGNLGALYYEAGRFSEAERLLTHSVEVLDNPGAVYLAEHKSSLAEAAGARALNIWQNQNATTAGAALAYTIFGGGVQSTGPIHLESGTEAGCC
jgi:tetratricopeptide (TPR) repeat protein